ncbi:hypothetical protein [Pseudooceanicola sp.]
MEIALLGALNRLGAVATGEMEIDEARFLKFRLEMAGPETGPVAAA